MPLMNFHLKLKESIEAWRQNKVSLEFKWSAKSYRVSSKEN